MPLVLIIIGILLIIYSLKLNDNSSFNNENYQNNFKTIIEYYEENNDIKNKIIELEENITYINENILALNLLIEEINNKLNLTADNNRVIDKNHSSYNKELKQESDTNKLNEKILQLYNSGMSIEEISSKLRIGKGEVLLRIGLKR
ncbi:DUF6115 domain-containing protein [Thermobrachium celere]|uniref:DUF6115 domain-containing protein n=1 Tax=Thermobrachium celere TaxID=53422 RepID=UPI0019416CC2|nr:hypothetical protein [Thermobrachium celere]GFR35580.1 hypothetical protein TCEA9_13920 [Thermobrachium celere]